MPPEAVKAVQLKVTDEEFAMIEAARAKKSKAA